MVFFDPSGTRRALFFGSSIAVLLLFSGFGALAYLALILAPTEERIAYDNASQNDARFSKTIALTFDDGPDPVFTPKLAELLQKENVPATFFFIGENVARHPNLAKRIVDEGFEIGNHTFTHSARVGDSESRLRKELVTTDHVIRDATGKHPLLFRPPYLEDVNVGEFDGGKIEGEEVRWAEDLGYVVVGANLDTQDWRVQKGESGTVLERLMSGTKENGPTVIIMHDSAGEGASIEALETFIPLMKEKGYRFVFVSEYFGLTKAEAMPDSAPTFGVGYFLVGAAKIFARVAPVFNTIVMVVSVLGLSRIWLVVAGRRLLVPRASAKEEDAFVPTSALSIETIFGELRATLPARSASKKEVSVIIPAYNEEANIEATVRSIMREPHMQTIVVNDGSTDTTGDTVRKLCEEYGPSLLLLEKENGGSKAAALNYALPYATSDILVCVDADTIISPGTIERLAKHFHDRDVGAVAGKVYPASTHTLIEKIQYLEYLQGQNLEKMVFALGNAVGVVPGAIGAWRKSALLEGGGYSRDTVVEDQDLTLSLLSRDWSVRFEPSATAFTETPNNLLAFFKQRSRWVYGTMQCAWKYRTFLFSFRRPSLGWLILPNVIFFNLFVPLLVPFIDGAILLGLMGYVDISAVLGPFLVYTVFDLWCVAESARVERVKLRRLLPLIIWQRLFYRYIMAAAIVRGIFLALGGSWMRWGTHERRGDCHAALQDMLTLSPLQPQLVPARVANESPQPASLNISAERVHI
ncbi:glycosyltransferase [Candidatus Kaiserbacteria bacterium]|nr:glycosyltransferase [Candidatus Kaiserbacteria bacterium]